MMLFPVTPQAFVYTYSCVCFVLVEIQKIGEIQNRVVTGVWQVRVCP